LKLHEFIKRGWDGTPPFLFTFGDTYQCAEVLRRAKESLFKLEGQWIEEKLESPRGLAEALDLYQTLGMWRETRYIEIQIEDEFSEKHFSTERARLLARAKSEPTGNVLLVRCATVKASAWLTELEQVCCVVDCHLGKTSKKDLQLWLLSEAQERQLKLSSTGAYELLNRLGDQLGVLENALTLMELSNQAQQTWGPEQIQSFFSLETQSSVFELAEALSNQDLNRSLVLMNSLFDRGAKVVELLGALRNQFRRLLLLKFNQGQWSETTMLSQLRIPKFALEKTLRQAEKFNLPRLRKVYNELYHLDWSSKSSSERERDLFEMFILRLFFGS
jgi:DNA polymerase III delta subunit